MKRILMYGDSNTWGMKPGTTQRYNEHERVTGILGSLLGRDYRVIEEGLCGRTTVVDDPIKPYRNGFAYFQACIESHQPLDIIIIMLGTNDMKLKFQMTAKEISNGLERLLRVANYCNDGTADYAPRILIISPIHINKNNNQDTLRLFGPFRGRELSKELSLWYQKLAKKYRVEFLDASDYAEASIIDGIHMDTEQHNNLAAAIYQCLIEKV